jgi:hypothetical protein
MDKVGGGGHVIGDWKKTPLHSRHPHHHDQGIKARAGRPRFIFDHLGILQPSVQPAPPQPF